MGVTNQTIWHDWSTGATDNGGAFDPANANMATDLTVNANTANTTSPIVSSASYSFITRDEGHWLFVQGGTNWIPGWYPIVSTSGGKATINGTAGVGVLYQTDSLGNNYRRPNGVTTAVGIATTGTPTGGIWTIDYSQKATNVITFTDLVIDGAVPANMTSSANPFAKSMIGNCINVTSGTGFTVQRNIVSNVTGTTANMLSSNGTLGSTGGNGKMGGAVGTGTTMTAPGSMVPGNKIFRKGTLTLSATFTLPTGVKGDISGNPRCSIEGFTTLPSARDGRPTITSATNSVILFTLNDHDFWEFVHLNLTHTAATRGAAFTVITSLSAPLYVEDCVIDGVLTFCNAGINSMIWHLIGVEIKNTTSAVAAISFTNAVTIYGYGLDVHDNTAGDGIRCTGATNVISLQDCIFYNNLIGINHTGATASLTLTIHSVLFVAMTNEGIKIAATSGSVTLEMHNNVWWSNGSSDINNLDGLDVANANMRINRNNASGDNGAARVGVPAGRGDVVLSATDPFVDSSNRNFEPNDVAGGGLLLRGMAFPGLFTSGATRDWSDIGIQHEETAGGGGLATAVIGNSSAVIRGAL